MDVLNIDISATATIAIGVAIGGTFGGGFALTLFAMEINLKNAVRIWVEDRIEVRLALRTIERYEGRQNDTEYQRLNGVLGDPKWDEMERADVAKAYRTIEALGSGKVSHPSA
jgi:hypothetical protein